MRLIILGILTTLIMASCQNQSKVTDTDSAEQEERTLITKKYVPFTLTTDLGVLKESEKAMLPLLIKAADIMDDLFWFEAYGDKEALLSSLTDPAELEMAVINYGPWDRLDGNSPFVEGVGEKPLSANFYPSDMTKEEFEASDLEDKASLYTFLRRDSSGSLITVPYHVMFKDKVSKAAYYLEKASELTEDDMLRVYLHKRAQALMNDEYQDSDMAWLDMKHNTIDVVIGPIETYEDHIYGYKAAHEAYVLIKDQEWSKRLARYAEFLPGLQEGLPVDDKYKQEKPGNDVDLNAYDVIYYAGDCNAGSKTIAINLPNDEEVQLKKGTRRLQLKNAMKAKFDKILVPIADVLIDESQRQHITFDAFFSNTMFHEVAHGLGIKNTINNNGTVRQALRELSSALEEGKADILGLYMINQLHEMGELEADLKDFYVTFMAGIFRSVRFGASSAHGKANMIRFNYFKEAGAFSKNEETGRYTVNFDKFEEATQNLSKLILTIQGDGDYAGCKELVDAMGIIGGDLQADLDRLGELGIPVDIVFEQGLDVLGLE